MLWKTRDREVVKPIRINLLTGEIEVRLEGGRVEKVTKEDLWADGGLEELRETIYSLPWY